MKKLNKKQKLIIAIAIVLIVVILAIVITTNIISTNNNLASEGYLATISGASSNLIASYIREGVEVGGIIGTLEVLDTSDATATPAEIAYGKTAYVNGKKITGTYMEGIKDWVEGVPIPDGFYYAGGTRDNGIIISDSSDDANKGDDKTASEYVGNQFVWVPVENPDVLFGKLGTTGEQLTGVDTTTNIYSKLTIRSGDSFTAGTPGETSKVREPDVLSSYDTSSSYADIILGTSGTGNATELSKLFVAEYKAMADSIKKYNGFYIGRYELTGSVDSPAEKSGVSLIGENWYNLYKACKNVVQDETGVVKSTMIYGVQWDATMDWLRKCGFNTDKDSSSWGNYSNSTGNAKIDGKSGSKQDTGFSEYWKANNIYDLAGNHWEWTQEAYSTSTRVYRRWLLQQFWL